MRFFWILIISALGFLCIAKGEISPGIDNEAGELAHIIRILGLKMNLRLQETVRICISELLHFSRLVKAIQEYINQVGFVSLLLLLGKIEVRTIHQFLQEIAAAEK